MKKLAILILGLGLLFSTVPDVLAKDWDPRLLQAARLSYAGDIVQATQKIDAYIKENPEDPNGLFVKALVMGWKATYEVEHWDEAQRAILKIYEKANNMAFHRWHHDPENIDKMIDLGNSYLFLGRKYADMGSWFKAILTGKKCQQHLDKAIKQDPNRPDAKFTLGGFRYIADNVPSGARGFRGLFGIKGDRVQGLQMIKESAEGEHPFQFDAQMMAYFFNFEYEKNYTEAGKWLQRLLNQFPNNPELRWRSARLAEHTQPDQGISEYLRFAKWCIDHTSDCHPQYVFLGYYAAGKAYKNKGKLDLAREMFQQALNYDRMAELAKRAEIYLWMGQIEESKGKSSEAIALYKKSVEVPGLSKDFRKEIERTLESACQKTPIPGSC